MDSKHHQEKQGVSPVIGITLGDPGGIGPEIIAKTLRILAEQHRVRCEFRVIGETKGCRPGKFTKKSGKVALKALEESVDLLKKGEIQGVVNGPVNKENLMKLGFKFPGQTEFYAECFGLNWDDVTMCMVAPKLMVSLVSAHCSLKKAVKLVTKKRIYQAVEQTLEGLSMKGVRRPRIAVCGLNPHAGEGGAFGREDREIIDPAVVKLQMKKDLRHAQISGPHSPDAVMRKAYEGGYDAVVCMYHDQGLIPFKLVAFEEGVNVTLGLPVFRCSPDHGTAGDIAGKGIANPMSMVSACLLAEKMVAR